MPAWQGLCAWSWYILVFARKYFCTAEFELLYSDRASWECRKCCIYWRARTYVRMSCVGIPRRNLPWKLNFHAAQSAGISLIASRICNSKYNYWIQDISSSFSIGASIHRFSSARTATLPLRLRGDDGWCHTALRWNFIAWFLKIRLNSISLVARLLWCNNWRVSHRSSQFYLPRRDSKWRCTVHCWNGAAFIWGVRLQWFQNQIPSYRRVHN